MRRRPPRSTRTDTLFPYTTLFRSHDADVVLAYGVARTLDPGRKVEWHRREPIKPARPGWIGRPVAGRDQERVLRLGGAIDDDKHEQRLPGQRRDRKSTRLNSSH